MCRISIDLLKAQYKTALIASRYEFKPMETGDITLDAAGIYDVGVGTLCHIYEAKAGKKDLYHDLHIGKMADYVDAFDGIDRITLICNPDCLDLWEHPRVKWGHLAMKTMMDKLKYHGLPDSFGLIIARDDGPYHVREAKQLGAKPSDHRWLLERFQKLEEKKQFELAKGRGRA